MEIVPQGLRLWELRNNEWHLSEDEAHAAKE